MKDMILHMNPLRRKKIGTLFAVSLSSFMTAYMGSSINIALPLIGREFSLAPSFLGWITMTYLLSTAVFLLPSGMCSDIRGRKKVFITGCVIIILASAGCVLSPTGKALLFFRIIQGSGAAMLFASSSPIITTAFSPEKRGKVLGISVAAVYLGLSAGPFLGGILAHWCGWRSLFYFNIIAMFVSLISGYRMIVPDVIDKSHHGKKFDIAGAILSGSGILCCMTGLTRITSRPGIPLAFAGTALLVLFLFHELKTQAPLVPVRVFRRNRVFIFSNLAAMINYSSTFAISFFLSLYLQYIKGYTPDRAGLILIAQPVLQAILSPAAGKLSDSRDPRVLSSAGMGIIASALLVFALYPGVLPVWLIITLLSILGVGFALFSSPNTNSVLGSVEYRHLGTASSVLSIMRVLGQVMSMAVAILLMAHFTGSGRIDADNSENFLSALRVGFIIFSALCLAGIPASWARGGKK
ncbi:MAG TPA: MFS transporter [Spirochaetota bacterium]|nr:MFS transporter [Spirochaetota bacterium]